MKNNFMIDDNKGKDCIICGENNFKQDVLASKILGLQAPYQIKKCKSCGNRELLPRLLEAAVATIKIL